MEGLILTEGLEPFEWRRYRLALDPFYRTAGELVEAVRRHTLVCAYLNGHPAEATAWNVKRDYFRVLALAEGDIIRA